MQARAGGLSPTLTVERSSHLATAKLRRPPHPGNHTHCIPARSGIGVGRYDPGTLHVTCSMTCRCSDSTPVAISARPRPQSQAPLNRTMRRSSETTTQVAGGARVALLPAGFAPARLALRARRRLLERRIRAGRPVGGVIVLLQTGFEFGNLSAQLPGSTKASSSASCARSCATSASGLSGQQVTLECSFTTPTYTPKRLFFKRT